MDTRHLDEPNSLAGRTFFLLKRHRKFSFCFFATIVVLHLIAVYQQNGSVLKPSRAQSRVAYLGKSTGLNEPVQHHLTNQTTTWRTTPTSKYLSTDKFHGILVDVHGPFIHRVKQFNIELGRIREQMLIGRQQNGSSRSWNDAVLRETTPAELIWGARDDYLELLAKQHRHVLTIALPWMPVAGEELTGEPSRESNRNTKRWNSLVDGSNVLVREYYTWTADEQLCTWIETPGAIKMKYDSIYNRTCERNQSSSAAVGRPLEPLFLNSKPLNRNHYWPNDGASFPAWFYTDPPPFVFHLHVHQDAVVNDIGDVFSGRSALCLYLCRNASTEPQTTMPENAASLPLYDEVLTLTQMWGHAVFHLMVEVMPRIAVYVDFLLANPEIKIQAPVSADTRFDDILRFFGLDEQRVVYGAVRAKIVYQPRPISCGAANVQESQLTSKYYRDHISRTVPKVQLSRNRLVLIRRTGLRMFTEQDEIETRLQSAANDFGLKYELFVDNPTPSLTDTMTMFNAAVLVVGPHGAGLSNLLFSVPGTFVVEGVCNIPHVNMCFQRLAHVLGHRWHGVTSRGGCEKVVDVSAANVDAAARNFLKIWNATKTTNAHSFRHCFASSRKIRHPK